MRSVAELIDLFRQGGHKITPQRRAIFKILSEDAGHPTAEEVYQRPYQMDPLAGGSSPIYAFAGPLGNIPVISAGVGYRGKRFEFDVAYQFGYGPAHTVTGSKPSSTITQVTGQRADGKYDFISHAVILTVGVHF